MDDSKIVDLYLQRNENAIKISAEKYGNRLRSLAYGILKDLQGAEECESDAYMKAWNAIPPHEPKEYLYAFLARIVRRIALNRCRDGGRLKRSAHITALTAEMEQCIPSQSNIESHIDDIALADAINSFLGKLDKEKRIIFVRRYWYLDSVADISNRFAISESKVKTTLLRLRNKLKEHLEKEDYAL